MAPRSVGLAYRSPHDVVRPNRIAAGVPTIESAPTTIDRPPIVCASAATAALEMIEPTALTSANHPIMVPRRFGLAAAVWFPTHAGPPDRVAAWGRDSYEVLANQAASGVPGVVMRESLVLYRQPGGGGSWTKSVLL